MPLNRPEAAWTAAGAKTSACVLVSWVSSSFATPSVKSIGLCPGGAETAEEGG
jgi:hypothetical protein